MARCVTLLACVVVLLGGLANAEWSWGGSSSADSVKEIIPTPAPLQGQASDSITQAIFGGPSLNGSNVDSVVDSILSSKREGRTLGVDAYQQVASEPALQRAIESGDDAEARHIVRERLCNLGLMACDDIEGKHPHGGISPHEVIYAQPVALKPVGQPIPAVPVRTPHAYPHHGGQSFNGPHPIGPPGAGGFPRPPYPVYKPQRRPPPIGVDGIYGPPKPVPFEPEYPLKQVHHHQKDVLVGPATGGAVTHVHHHYHHGGPGAGDLAGGLPGPIYPGFGKESPNTGGGFGANTGGGFGGFTKVPPVHEPDVEVDNPPFGSSFNPSFGGDYGSSFYKKELNVNNFNKKQITAANTLSNSYAGQYQGYENPRADNCYCVPLEQCAPNEVIGRKEDNTGYLIDPRNQGTEIEAEVAADGASEPVKRESAQHNGTDDVTTTTSAPSTETARTKREAEKDDAKAQPVTAGTRKGRNGKDTPDLVSEMEGLLGADEAAQHETRRNLQGPLEGASSVREVRQDNEPEEPQLRLFHGGGHHESKVRPTFGVSFGLPYGYGHPYPLNPFGVNPVVNPYFGSIGPGGLSLGPVSVNPLFSLQVTKDDDGDKIIKPLVNLHVTPNAGLIHKFKGFVGGIAGGYGHGHYPPPYPPPPPPFYSKPPPFFSKPPPPFHHHHPHPPPPPFHGPYKSHVDDYGPYDEDEEDDDSGEFIYPSGRGVDGLVNNTNAFRRTETVSSSYRGPKNLNPKTSYSNTSPPESSSSSTVKFPRNKRETQTDEVISERQFGGSNFINSGAGRCGPRQVCCRRPGRPGYQPNLNNGYPQCGRRNAQGINGRIKNPSYADGDSEFGEYPWQAAILKKDAHESVYVCGGTLIDSQHVVTAAHCVKGYNSQELRVRLGEWDVNHDVEFYPYIETDVSRLTIHPEFYAGTLFNDIAILKLARPIDLQRNPHISPACLPDPHFDFTGARCYTTGWGKDAFGDYGKYQNILKEVDIPVVSHHQCQSQLQQTRLGYDFKLHPGFVCAGGEEGKDACKGDGGSPMVCERGGSWQLVGVVSWGIGCGQYGVPGVYVKVSHYLDWIRSTTRQFN